MSGCRRPTLVVVADSSAAGARPLLAVVAQAVDGGARAVWLREKGLPPADRRRVAAQLADLLAPVGGILISSPGPGSEYAAGVHLGADDVQPGDCPTGRSCHSVSDLARAAAEGCRWATLSPVFLSVSKPGYGPALGLSALTEAPLPTWALGGVDANNARACLDAGAVGVAVMGAVLGAPDPAGAVAEILESVT
jgi:thiamine-phosphate pyrophosphorylase